MLALIALGTNLPFQGNGGAELLMQAVAALAKGGLPVTACSSVWESEAWPSGSRQPNYFNAVVAADAGGRAPETLFQQLLAIEAAFGRERGERWGPRTLDLDLLAMEGTVGGFGDITLPHPRMHERPFVLLPLAEVAPDWVHPVLGRTPTEMLAILPPETRPWVVAKLG
jgi:2-amino-4-hydroxy-6-hydroxymethyldihydropteridine diphosphokinase